MLLCIAIIAAVCFVVTICNCLFWPQVKPTNERFSQLVTVLIPARNEEENLPLCLETVIAQGSVLAEILVYDDHSTDNTSRLLKTYAAQYPLIKQVPPNALPSGWCGKNFACFQLARKAKGKWLLFLDADARLTPNAINRMLVEVQARQVSFLSCWPKFQMESAAERILMPLLNFVVYSIFPTPLLFLKRPKFAFNANLGLAHGACMFFERSSYEEFGGHERVKDQIFEDTRIAQLWRASGRKGICLDGQDIVSLRMYSSVAEIWAGFQKNFFPAFQHDLSFWIFLLLHSLIFTLPFILGVFISSPLIYLAIDCVLLSRLCLAIRFKHPLFSVLFHPVGELLLVVLGLTSWWRCKLGKGVAWKGREYLKTH